jgi:hypothetical protein
MEAPRSGGQPGEGTGMNVTICGRPLEDPLTGCLIGWVAKVLFPDSADFATLTGGVLGIRLFSEKGNWESKLGLKWGSGEL